MNIKDERIINRLKLLLKKLPEECGDYESMSMYPPNKVGNKLFARIQFGIDQGFDQLNHCHNDYDDRRMRAEPSRSLKGVIEALFEAKKLFPKIDFHVAIDREYEQRINYVYGFLKDTHGSMIPNDYVPLDIDEYSPMFSAEKTHTPSNKADAPMNIENITITHSKILLKIKNGDYAGSITSSATLLESVINHLYKIIKRDGDSLDPFDEFKPKKMAVKINKLAKIVKLHDSDIGDKSFRDIIDICANLVEKIGKVRNTAGDGHESDYSVKRHHAVLMADLSIALSHFLYDHVKEHKNNKSSVKPKPKP